jgi:hypothetical protein
MIIKSEYENVEQALGGNYIHCFRAISKDKGVDRVMVDRFTRLSLMKNRRSMDFLQKQGFVKVDVFSPTFESPICFFVMEVGRSLVSPV